MITILVIPLHYQTIEKVKAKQFFGQFESDLLLTQQLTIEKHAFFQIMFRRETNDYILYDGLQKKTVFKRTLPDKWQYQFITTKPSIRFNRDGTIRQPGTIRFENGELAYRVTFPFGTVRMILHET
ncbi:competence protein ComG [Halobacillus litoralis]|nr:competence protein ComG [Halobacillus litoralis]